MTEPSLLYTYGLDWSPALSVKSDNDRPIQVIGTYFAFLLANVIPSTLWHSCLHR